MPLIPDPRAMLADGVARAFRGLRTGDQRALLTGAAVAAFGWYRRTRPPTRTLIRRLEIKPGRSVVIRNGADQTRVDVVRSDDGAT